MTFSTLKLSSDCTMTTLDQPCIKGVGSNSILCGFFLRAVVRRRRAKNASQMHNFFTRSLQSRRESFQARSPGWNCTCMTTDSSGAAEETPESPVASESGGRKKPLSYERAHVRVRLRLLLLSHRRPPRINNHRHYRTSPSDPRLLREFVAPSATGWFS